MAPAVNADGKSLVSIGESTRQTGSPWALPRIYSYFMVLSVLVVHCSQGCPCALYSTTVAMMVAKRYAPADGHYRPFLWLSDNDNHLLYMYNIHIYYIKLPRLSVCVCIPDFLKMCGPIYTKLFIIHRSHT